MYQVTQSPFLQALGFAIINSLWQFALLWLIYVLLHSVVRLNAHQKYATALTLHFAGFSWFIGTIIYYYDKCRQLSTANDAVFNSQLFFTAPSAKEAILNALLRIEQVLPYLSLAYILLLVFLSLKTFQGYRNTRAIRVSGLQKIDVEWRLFVQKLSHQLGIKKQVKIYLSSMINSPLTVGFLKPLILLPVATLNNLTAEQVEAVLLHELAHIKRNDYLINLLVCIIEIALFFNPFMQLMSRHIKRERENSCDDWVLQYEYNASSYAKALLIIAKARCSRTPHFSMSATDNNKALLVRVKRMIEKNERTFNYRQQLTALLLMTMIISSIALFTRVKPSANGTNFADIASPLVEPLAAKIQNPFFNPVFFLAEEKKITREVIKEENRQLTKKAIEQVPSILNTKEKKQVFKNNPGQPNIEVKSVQPELMEFSTVNKLNNILEVKNVEDKKIIVDMAKIENELKRANAYFEKQYDKEWVNNEKMQREIVLAMEELKKVHIKLSNNDFNFQTSKTKGTEGKTMEPGDCEEEKLFNVKIYKIANAIRTQLLQLESRKKSEDAPVAFNLAYKIPQLPTTVYNNELANWSYTYREEPRHMVRTRVAATGQNAPRNRSTQQCLEEYVESNIRASLQLKERTEKRKLARKAIVVRI